MKPSHHNENGGTMRTTKRTKNHGAELRAIDDALRALRRRDQTWALCAHPAGCRRAACPVLAPVALLKEAQRALRSGDVPGEFARGAFSIATSVLYLDKYEHRTSGRRAKPKRKRAA